MNSVVKIRKANPIGSLKNPYIANEYGEREYITVKNYRFFTKSEVIIITNTKKQTHPHSVLSEIKYLRGMADFVIDQRNSNPYRVIVKEKTGYTAYCFSTPIYNINTHQLVHMEFNKTPNGYVFKGSNCTVSVCGNRCVFENKDARVIVLLNTEPKTAHDASCDQAVISVVPTLNGLRFIVKEKHLRFILSSDTKPESLRFNSAYFAIMQEKYKPVLSVATLYAQNSKAEYAPVLIRHQALEANTYQIDLSHDLHDGMFLFEINMYEPKLFQDTTVESIHPNTNNAFGAVGFIGKTQWFGDQWLYSRPDFSKIPELTTRRVNKVMVHIPIFNGNGDDLAVYTPRARFCSFGSTWKKKIKPSEKRTSCNHNGRYFTIDATAFFTNQINCTLDRNEGLILKKATEKNNYFIISTGDCYSAPQILEIKYQ